MCHKPWVVLSEHETAPAWHLDENCPPPEPAWKLARLLHTSKGRLGGWRRGWRVFVDMLTCCAHNKADNSPLGPSVLCPSWTDPWPSLDAWWVTAVHHPGPSYTASSSRSKRNDSQTTCPGEKKTTPLTQRPCRMNAATAGTSYLYSVGLHLMASV